MAIDPAQKNRWLREFKLNGFVILRGFLPESFVESLWEQILPILRGEKEKGDRGDTPNKRGPNRYSFDVGAYAKLLGGPLADPRYLAHPDIEELVEAILGPRDAWGRGWSRIECAFQGSEHMGWHSDQVLDETADPHGPNKTVRAYNIPLVDFTWANGATEFIPGTHLQPRAEVAQGVLDVANIYPVRPDLRRGDAMLRDGHMLHRGAPNLTDVPRAMLDQTYRTAKAGESVTLETVDVDISGLGVRFEGLTAEVASELRLRWHDYVRGEGISPSLLIRVEDGDTSMTPSRFMSGDLHIEALPDAVRFRRDEGELVQDVPGFRAVVRLSQGDTGRRFWGLVNLALAAAGWRLLTRGGGALHAAGVVIDGRAYLLVGPSGCGKTTWARTAAEAGIPVLSDDCVLVETSAGGLSALGSPFRSSDFKAPGPGRWPVAALLIPRHAKVPALAPVNRLMLEARISANLLFSTPAWASHEIAAPAVGAIVSGAPARILDFRPDASWIELVRTVEAR